MAAAAVVADAGKAGGNDLRDQRYALRDVLVLAEKEHQQRHQNSTAGHAQKAGHDAADTAGQKPSQNVG